MGTGAITRSDVHLADVIRLRFAVGRLGERDHANWWTSGFMSASGGPFLAPVFGERVPQAQYLGVLEAARRVHDDRIGVGRAFHPFRLPEEIEHRLFETVRSSGSALAGAVSSPQAASDLLHELSGKPARPRSGPALVGSVRMLEEGRWVSEAAALYAAAFASGDPCFPYFSGS